MRDVANGRAAAVGGGTARAVTLERARADRRRSIVFVLVWRRSCSVARGGEVCTLARPR